jgi:hypothetical protein
MRINPHKTVTANSKGIIISFRDVNKHRFISYENLPVEENQSRDSKVSQQMEQPVFNKIQQKLYAEAVYGLSYYTEDEVQKMPKSKKIFLLSRYAKTQRILNRWKQEIVYERVDKLLLALFPNSPITKQLVETKGYDREFHETHSFKELGLNQKDIAVKLIEVNLLPQNFFELT